MVEKVSQSNNQQSSTRNRHFFIEVPHNVSLSPSVILRYLEEKYANIYNVQDEGMFSSFLIHSTQPEMPLSNTMDIGTSKKMKPFVDHPCDNSNSSSEVRIF